MNIIDRELFKTIVVIIVGQFVALIGAFVFYDKTNLLTAGVTMFGSSAALIVNYFYRLRKIRLQSKNQEKLIEGQKGIGDYFVISQNNKLRYHFTTITRNGVYSQCYEGRPSIEYPGLIASGTVVKKHSVERGYEVARDIQFTPDFPEEEKSKINWCKISSPSHIIKRRLL